jgi:hypothetical protein
MNAETAEHESSVVATRDLRLELVGRILASESFAKSARLRSFLTYICDLSFQGRDDEINELTIGSAVFGRALDYDPSIDGIVRSHASRLRQKLAQYFSEEGIHEPVRLLIPKGGYIPVFVPHHLEKVRGEGSLDADRRRIDTLTRVPEKAVPQRDSSRHWLLLLSLAFLMACGAIFYLLRHPRTIAVGLPTPLASHPLWKNFFGPGHYALIIPSDSDLALFQQKTNQSVTLQQYLDEDYRERIISSPDTPAKLRHDVSVHRNTSVVDLLLITRFHRLPGVQADQVRVHYARDIRPNDLKSAYVILMGSPNTNPWVDMFDEGMNFRFQNSPDRGVSSIVNVSPHSGELPRYDSDPADPRHREYSVVALRPNLRDPLQVLILEGTSMAGTEAAADFVLDDKRLRPFLAKIRNPDGSIPYFELLLQSSNMSGNSSRSEIVAYRTSRD